MRKFRPFNVHGTAMAYAIKQTSFCVCVSLVISLHFCVALCKINFYLVPDYQCQLTVEVSHDEEKVNSRCRCISPCRYRVH